MKFTVLKAMQLPTGSQVKLTEEQARRRGAQVAVVKGRLYECLVPVWFKAGEIIDLDEPAKHVQASLDAFDKAVAKKAAAAAELEAKAEAEALDKANAEANAHINAVHSQVAADTAPGSLLPAHS